jgi:hypothetical protein
MIFTYGGKTINFDNATQLAIAIEQANMPRLKSVVESLAQEALEEEVYSRPESENYTRTNELKDAIKVEEDDREDCGVVVKIDGSVFTGVGANEQKNAHRGYYFPSEDEERLLDYMKMNQKEDVMGAIEIKLRNNFKKEFMYGKNY